MNARFRAHRRAVTVSRATARDANARVAASRARHGDARASRGGASFARVARELDAARPTVVRDFIRARASGRRRAGRRR